MQRIIEIQNYQKEVFQNLKHPIRKAVRMVPLIDILSVSLGVKTKTAKSILTMYKEIIQVMGSERFLWEKSNDEVKSSLEGVKTIPPNITQDIMSVKNGNFTFDPMGYDGLYGDLKIEKPKNPWQINITQI